MKKKILTMAFTFFVSLLVGISNVFAEEIKMVNSESDFAGANINSATSYKLSNNVKLTDATDNIFNLYDNFTIDLNGYDLIINNETIVLKYYASDKIASVIDSSTFKTGNLIVNSGDKKAISVWEDASVSNGSLIIDGITYVNKTKFFSNFGNHEEFTLSASHTLSFAVYNSQFKTRGALLSIDGIDTSDAYLNYDIKNSVIDKYRPNDSAESVSFLNDGSGLKYGDLIDTNDYEVYSRMYSTKILRNNTDLITYNSYHGLEVLAKKRFEVTAPIFNLATEGYEDIESQNIAIKAIGGDVEIDYVDIDNHTDFIFTGLAPTDEHNVLEGQTNTVATIKPIEGLTTGNYETTITVVDTEGNSYYQRVSFNVGNLKLIDCKDDYLDNKSILKDTILKLTDSFELTGVSGPGNQDAINVSKNLIIDLNGQTLTLNWNAVKLNYGGSYTVQIIDSSLAGTGKIVSVGNDSGISMHYLGETEGTASLIIENVDIERGDNYPDDLTIWRKDNPNKKFDVTIRNSNFKSNQKSININGGDVDSVSINIEPTTTFTNVKNTDSDKISTGGSSYLQSFADMVDTTRARVLVKETLSSEETELDASSIISENSNKYVSFRIVEKSRFEVFAPEFEPVIEGYGEQTAMPISIMAFVDDRTIKNVEVNGTDFEIDGPEGDILVNGGNTNTQFTIKPKTGLSIGTHTAKITVLDTNDIEHYATISFDVTRDPEIPIAINNIAEYDDKVAYDRRDGAAIYKLMADINLTGINDMISIYDDVTIDLNGFDLITNKNYILNLSFYEDGKIFRVIDSTANKEGKLIGTNTEYNSHILSAYVAGNKTGTIELDGITVESDTPYLFDSGVGLYNNNLNVNIINSLIKKDGKIFDNLGIMAENYSINFENTTIEPKTAEGLVGFSHSSMDVSDLIDTEAQIVKVIPSDGSVFEFIPNDTRADKENYKKIVIESNERFDVAAPEFAPETEGYASITGKAINITAVNGNRTIKKVEVDGTDFEINGPEGEVLVNNEVTNTQFTIKPKNGLKFGVYTATITVTDTNDNEYTSVVTFDVATYAETQIVMNEAELRKFLDEDNGNYPGVKTIKLGSDIIVNGWLGIYVRDGKTLDLAGFTLTTNEYFSVYYGENHNGAFNIIDSMPSKLGTIKSTYDTRDWSLFIISINYKGSEDANFEFNINGGTYIYDNATAGIVSSYYSSGFDNNDRLDINIKNANFYLKKVSFNKLMYITNPALTKDNFKINLEDITVNLKGSGSGLIQENLDLTVGDIIPETHHLVYPKIVEESSTHYSTDEPEVAERSELAKNISLSGSKPEIDYYQIKVVKNEGFEVSAVDFGSVNYGYAAVSAKPISIKAVGSNKTVESVTVNNSSLFIVHGTGNPTISSGNTDDTTFSIEPNPTLPVGTHSATITVEDSEHNTYTAPVTFEVTKADITPSVSIDNWEYSTTAKTPVVTGNLESGTETFKYVGIGLTNYQETTTAPTEVGTYKVIATIGETGNYNSATCEDTFEITKKTINVDESKITINNKYFDRGTEIDYTIDADAMGIPDGYYSSKATITYKDTTANEYAGNYKATLTITINPQYANKYQFSNGTYNYTTNEYSYKILPAISTINSLVAENEEIIKGTTTNLSNLVSLDYSFKEFIDFSNNIAFALDGTYTGVTLSGNELTVAGSAVTDTIVKVKVNYAGQDISNDSSELELAAAPEITLYLKVVDKPSQTFNKTSSTINMEYGSTNDNAYAVTTTNGGTVTYTSSNTDYVVVDTNGKLTAKKVTTTPVTIIVTAQETATHAETLLTYEVNVSVKDVTVSAGTYKVTKTYDGTTTKVNGTGTLDISGILETDTEVTVVATTNAFSKSDVYNTNESVSLALSGTGSDNYNLINTTLSVPYSITPKTITPIIAITGAYTYTGSAITPTYTVKDGATDINTNQYTARFEDNIDAGQAKVIVTANNDANYNWSEKTQEFMIGKENFAGTITELNREVLENNEKSYEIDLTEISLPAGFKNATIKGATKSGELIKSVSATDNKVTYTVESKPANTTGTLTVTISSKNYNDKDVTVNVKAVSKTLVTISGLTFASRDYNKSAIVPSGTLTADNDYDVNNLEVIYEGVAPTVYSPSSEAPINAGTYKVTYKVPDSDSQYTGKIEYNFEITKATPTYENPTGLKAVKETKLKDITLPSGLSWNNEEDVVAVGTNTYKITFTPTDTNNYIVLTNEDITIYGKDKFAVDTNVSGGNGTVSAGKTDVVEGDNFEVTFTPNIGYMIDEVKVDGTLVTTTDNKLTLTNITSNKIVTVTYKKVPCTITIKEVTGADINPSGSITVSYGDDKNIEIKANYGYELKSVKVDGSEKISTLTDNILSITNITKDTKIDVLVEKIVYKVIEGANLKTDKTDKIRFRFDADYSKFVDGGKIYIDGNLVEKDNYTSDSGSTIITLNDEYAKTLSKGNHTIKAVFNDGGEASTNFTILDTIKNPKTGDKILTSIVLFTVSAIGIAATTVLGKKNKFQK